MTNYLKGKTVYLAGPIHALQDDGIGWRNNLTPKLEELGLIVDDPCKKTINGLGEVKEDKIKFNRLLEERKIQELKELFYPIVRKDLRSVDKSDFIIVVYDPTIHMCGTIAEIILSHEQRKPILMYIDPEKFTKTNPWILTYVKTSCVFDNWDNMLKYLNVINNGIFDTSYWTL
jgi:nucleoside 2-deoxyribosyltransferase